MDTLRTDIDARPGDGWTIRRLTALSRSIALPAALIGAAFREPLKYLTAPPGFAITLALCLAAWGGWAEYARIQTRE